jgi:hypothetical protein
MRARSAPVLSASPQQSADAPLSLAGVVAWCVLITAGTWQLRPDLFHTAADVQRWKENLHVPADGVAAPAAVAAVAAVADAVPPATVPVGTEAHTIVGAVAEASSATSTDAAHGQRRRRRGRQVGSSGRRRRSRRSRSDDPSDAATHASKGNGNQTAHSRRGSGQQRRRRRRKAPPAPKPRVPRKAPRRPQAEDDLSSQDHYHPHISDRRKVRCVCCVCVCTRARVCVCEPRNVADSKATRPQAIRAAMIHAVSGYRRHAFGHDEARRVARPMTTTNSQLTSLRRSAR